MGTPRDAEKMSIFIFCFLGTLAMGIRVSTAPFGSETITVGIHFKDLTGSLCSDEDWGLLLRRLGKETRNNLMSISREGLDKWHGGLSAECGAGTEEWGGRALYANVATAVVVLTSKNSSKLCFSVTPLPSSDLYVHFEKEPGQARNDKSTYTSIWRSQIHRDRR